jgi:HD-GYP domain-containing protein (c-di-GMP phosphodiesterase class II)
MHFTPVMFGSRPETMAGIMRALATPDSPAPARALQVAHRLPRAVRGHRRHLAALCEVAQMLTDWLGLPASVSSLFVGFTERWDGKGDPDGVGGDQIPLATRIVHVARDAAFQCTLGDAELAARVVRGRACGAFDPVIAACLSDNAAEILAADATASAWDETLACEPRPPLMLDGEAVDRALAAMGDFADLISPYLAGHSAGVAELATAAAQRCGFEAADLVAIRRAALVHDLGRSRCPPASGRSPDR